MLNSLIRRFNQIFYSYRVRRKAAVAKGRVYTGGKTFVTSNTYLSENVSFNGMSMFGEGRITIGRNFHSGMNCQIITSFHDYDTGTKIPYDNKYIHKDVIIDDNVWIGNNVIILGGSHIGEGAVIQAGSTVVGEVPPGAIAGGHPARVFKFRNMEHYEELKRLEQFY